MYRHFLRHVPLMALIVILVGILAGCSTPQPAHEPEKYKQWIQRVDQSLKQATQSHKAKAEWLDPNDFSSPSVSIEVSGFTARDARGLAHTTAEQFMREFPKDEKIFIHVYDADSLEEIYFDMYTFEEK